MVISEIKGSVLHYSIHHKNVYDSPPIFPNIIVSSKQSLAQLKSQELIGHIKQHLCHQCVRQLTKTELFLTRSSEVGKEGNVLFNNALNTFYLRLYGVRHMVKDHSYNYFLFQPMLHDWCNKGRGICYVVCVM